MVFPKLTTRMQSRLRCRFPGERSMVPHICCRGCGCCISAEADHIVYLCLCMMLLDTDSLPHSPTCHRHLPNDPLTHPRCLSSTHPTALPLTLPPTSSLTRPPTHSLTHSVTHSPTPSATHTATSFASHPPTSSLAHPPTHSLARSLSHRPAHLFTNPPTHPPA